MSKQHSVFETNTKLEPENLCPLNTARLQLTYLVLLIATWYVPLQAQSLTGYQHVWSSRLLSGNNTTAVDLATDPQGNPVVVGTLGNDIYLAKYSFQDGSTIWSRRFSKGGILQNTRIAVGSSGNIALGMGFNGPPGKVKREWAPLYLNRVLRWMIAGRCPQIKGGSSTVAKPLAAGIEFAQFAG
jgi:hypothetical protein